jgi:crossover junction endodeoxyribonuclease RuvC
MRILAIDPGYDRLGVAIIDKVKGSKEELVFSDCIETDKETEYEERLATVGDAISTLLEEYKPDVLALETLFFSKNQTTAFKVAQVRGAALYLAQKNGLSIKEYNPQSIKVAVTGYGKSDKKQMIFMTEKLLPTGKKKALDDEYDAIAIGLTCIAHERY